MKNTLAKKITKKTILISSAIIISVLSVSLASALSKIKEFSDVPTGEYYTAAVYNMQEKGIVQGDLGKDTYRPGDGVNRAEIAVISDRIIYYNDEENRKLQEEIAFLKAELETIKSELGIETSSTEETENSENLDLTEENTEL